MELFCSKNLIFKLFQLKNILLTPLKHSEINLSTQNTEKRVQKQEIKSGLLVLKKFILVVWNGLNDDFFSHHQNPATLLFLIRDWKIIQIIFCSKTDFIDILRNLNHIIYVIFNIWEPKCISHIISCTSSMFDAF